LTFTKKVEDHHAKAKKDLLFALEGKKEET